MWKEKDITRVKNGCGFALVNYFSVNIRSMNSVANNRSRCNLTPYCRRSDPDCLLCQDKRGIWKTHSGESRSSQEGQLKKTLSTIQTRVTSNTELPGQICSLLQLYFTKSHHIVQREALSLKSFQSSHWSILSYVRQSTANKHQSITRNQRTNIAKERKFLTIDGGR